MFKALIVLSIATASTIASATIVDAPQIAFPGGVRAPVTSVCKNGDVLQVEAAICTQYGSTITQNCTQSEITTLTTPIVSEEVVCAQYEVVTDRCLRTETVVRELPLSYEVSTYESFGGLASNVRGSLISTETVTIADCQ